jgi:predicted nucleic acid-binding protein
VLSRDLPRDCILDACSLINLAVMPTGAFLLERLDFMFHAPEQALFEVVGARRPHQEKRAKLLQHVRTCRLEDPSDFKLFEDFVSRDGRRALGDGEAAALALAHRRGMIVVTDDGPALNVVQKELSGHHYTSVGLIRLGLSSGLIGEVDAQEALQAALSEARMAVRTADLAWVATLLGDDALAAHWHLKNVTQRLAVQRGGG